KPPPLLRSVRVRPLAAAVKSCRRRSSGVQGPSRDRRPRTGRPAQPASGLSANPLASRAEESGPAEIMPQVVAPSTSTLCELSCVFELAYVHEFSKDLEAEINKGRRVDRLMCLVVDERPRTAADHDRQAALGDYLEAAVALPQGLQRKAGEIFGGTRIASVFDSVVVCCGPSGTAGAFNDFELDALL
ncbi:MAG: hypothetical protein BJ554DRAFT_4064, partial [Olpidium bornovanus]